MARRGHQKRLLAGTCAAVLACVSNGLAAQDAAGLQANLSFAQGLTFSNTDGVFGRTELGFGITSTTRSQSLDFNIDGAFREDFDDPSIDVEDPRLTLAYAIESRQTSVTTNLSYRRSDADAFVDNPDELPGVLILDEGLREDIGASVGLAFGREARFGGSVNLGYRDLSYSDTTSPDLVDTETTTTGLNLRFEIDPRITATLGYNRTDTSRASNRNTLSQQLTAGAQLAVTQSLDADVSVGLSQVAVTDAGVETVQDGLTYNIGLTQARPRAELRFALSSDVSESGTRTTATIGGTYELTRGEFNATIGLSEGTDNILRPLVRLAYRQDMARGSYSVALDQEFSNTSDGDEVLNSRLRLNWQQDLNRSSRVSSNVTYQMTDALGGGDDTSRLEFGLAYNYDLTEDWALTTRYVHSITSEDGSDTDRENEVFVGVQTSFGWRP